MKQRSGRCAAADRSAACASVSLAGELIGIILWVGRQCRRHHREPQTGDEPTGPRNLPIIYRRMSYRRLSALVHCMTIALFRDESE
jgi:hypothetical protein